MKLVNGFSHWLPKKKFFCAAQSHSSEFSLSSTNERHSPELRPRRLWGFAVPLSRPRLQCSLTFWLFQICLLRLCGLCGRAVAMCAWAMTSKHSSSSWSNIFNLPGKLNLTCVHDLIIFYSSGSAFWEVGLYCRDYWPVALFLKTIRRQSGIK